MHTHTHREKGRERGRETNVPIVACPLVLCTYSETRREWGRRRGRANELWHSAGNPARMSESNQASKSLAEKPKASESLL